MDEVKRNTYFPTLCILCWYGILKNDGLISMKDG